MKKTILLIIFLGLCLVSVCAFEQDLTNIVKSLPNQQRSIAVGFITYADTKLSTPFTAWFTDALEKAVLDGTKFELVNQRAREQVIDELMVGLSGMTDERNAMGAMTQIQLMVNGRFYEKDKSIVVNLEFLNMETSSIEKKAEITISRDELPLQLQIVPDNFANAQAVLDELAKLDAGEGSGLQIRAWTNKGQSGLFKEGESMVVNFFASKNCYIKIYHINVDGDMSLIFPNEFHSANFVRGKQIYKIPDASYGFEFKMVPPFGAEFIFVKASTVQFAEIEKGLESQGGFSGAKLTRGLVVKAKDALTAETRISYTILQ